MFFDGATADRQWDTRWRHRVVLFSVSFRAALWCPSSSELYPQGNSRWNELNKMTATSHWMHTSTKVLWWAGVKPLGCLTVVQLWLSMMSVLIKPERGNPMSTSSTHWWELQKERKRKLNSLGEVCKHESPAALAILSIWWNGDTAIIRPQSLTELICHDQTSPMLIETVCI